jgi:hypothetical protein
MSQEETLRLVATVSDKFSGPIAAMRKSLEGLTQRNVASHKAGRQAALAHEKAFVDLRKAVKETGEHVKGILEPAMGALGIGAISTGAAIAGVTAAIKGFADSSRSLEFARKETGLAIKLLREYEALAPTIGSTPEAMDQGFRKLAGNLDQWRHRLGPLREFFSSRFGEGASYIRQLGEELVHTTDNAKALSKINALAAMMPKESERRAFYEAMGLDPNLARKKGRELTDALSAIGKRIGELTPADEAKGLAAAEAFDRIRESVSKLKDEIGSELAPAMAQMTDSVREFISAHGEDLRKLFVDVAHAIETAPWKEWGNDVRDAASKIDGVAQSIGGWKVALEGLIAVNVLAWLAPIATIIGPMGVAIGAAVAGLVAVAAKIKELNEANAGASGNTKDVFERMRHAESASKVFNRMRHGEAPPKAKVPRAAEEPAETGVHAAARAIRKKISGPEDEAPHYGRLTPISYGGDTGAASFRGEDILQRAVLKGTTEGTRVGVLDAFRAWVQERRQGAGGFTNANYQPGASGGMGGGYGGLGAGVGAPEGGGAKRETPEGGGAGREAPTAKSPASRSEPSEAAAARAMKDFAAGGNEQAGGNPTLAQIVADARSKAAARGVDPDLATGIILGESGLHKPGDRRKNSSNWDVNGPSYGAWQLHTPRGLGSEYLKEHPGSTLDVSAWRSHNAFAIDRIARHGTGDWMSVRDRGGVANITRQGHAWAVRYANEVAAASRAVDERKQAAKREAPKSETHPAVKGMNEWIEKQRGAHPDGAHHIHRPWDGRIGHRQPLSADIGRYIANGGGITSQAHKVTGDASLKISLAGFPKGTKTKAEINGLFKTLTMYRGLAAPMAGQES